MSVDAEYAQKQLLKDKNAALQAEAISEKVFLLSSRMDSLQIAMNDIRNDLRSIKLHIGA